MEPKRVTQWFNWNEWKSVVDDAYNEENDKNAYRRAFTTILAWEARDPNLPSALLCLKELLIAKLTQLNRLSDTIDQIYTYQTSLSMNVVRFVNFITEPYQKNVFAKPVKTIATEIGIPDWIVNLRHNATHYNLPSIEILEKALDYLFDWIKERYVSNYKENAKEQSILSEVKETIQNLFIDYMNTQYQATLLKSKNNKTKDLSSDLIVKLEELTYHFKKETFEILLDDGYMIPTRDQLTAFGIVSEEFIEQESLFIPKSFFNIWHPFLTYCNENNLVELLFKNLVNSYTIEAERGDYMRKKFLLSWIINLIKSNSFKNEKSRNAKYYFEFSFKQVLLDILSSTNPTSLEMHFLNEISKIPSFSNEIKANDLDKLKTILNFVCTASTPINDQYETNQMESDDQTVYNMDLFEKNKKKQKTEFFIRMQTTNSDWKLIDDLEWNQLKLGLAEGQTYTNLNLDINQYFEESSITNNNETNLNKSSITNCCNTNLNENNKKMSNNQTLSISDLISKDNLNLYKKSLMINYWEFSS